MFALCFHYLIPLTFHFAFSGVLLPPLFNVLLPVWMAFQHLWMPWSTLFSVLLLTGSKKQVKTSERKNTLFLTHRKACLESFFFSFSRILLDWKNIILSELSTFCLLQNTCLQNITKYLLNQINIITLFSRNPDYWRDLSAVTQKVSETVA